MAHAEVLSKLGHVDEARAAAHEAADRYARKGAVAVRSPEL